MNSHENTMGRDLTQQIEAICRESHRKFRAGLREILREVRPRRHGNSPLGHQLDRLDGGLTDARLAERQAAADLAQAEGEVERARASLLRAVEKNRYGPEVVSLEVRVREAEHELGVRRRALSSCRRARERAEGEHLSYSRFS